MNMILYEIKFKEMDERCIDACDSCDFLFGTMVVVNVIHICHQACISGNGKVHLLVQSAGCWFSVAGCRFAGRFASLLAYAGWLSVVI